MHLLVTGGCGFVGTPLVGALLEKGLQVTVVDAMWFGNHLKPHQNLSLVEADIRDISSIPLKGVDALIHLANVANDPSVELNEVLAWEINALSSMQLADQALRAGVKQFIFASSGSVYGVTDEPQVTEDLPLVPISAYNKTKMVTERVLLSYQDKMLVQCLRPATICGYSSRMRLDLSVNMLTMQALTKKHITVFGGQQTRPNIHIDDMVGAYLHLLDAGDKAPGIYNAGFENMSILDIAETVAQFVPAEISVTESNDPRSYRLNSDKLLSTGFKPQKTVADGIADVINAYEQGLIRNEDSCYNVRWMKQSVLKA